MTSIESVTIEAPDPAATHRLADQGRGRSALTGTIPATTTRHEGDHQMPGTQKPARRTTSKTAPAFTAEERAAMKERVRELKAPARRGSGTAKKDGESEVLAKIAEMQEPDRVLAEMLHALVGASAPDMEPTTWYGMPAYAKDGKVLCFFQSAQKFKTRYATLGFSDKANLDDGTMWPVYYALTSMTGAAKEKITELLTRAAS